MRRRAYLAAAGLALAGCLGRPETEPDSGVSTTTGEATPTAPLVNFSFALDAERERATVTHDTGEELTTAGTDRLELVLTTAPDRPIPTDVTLTPTRTPQVFTTSWREAGGRYPIAPGDEVTVEPATPGDTLEVVWYGVEAHPEGTRLESHTFPKA